MLKDIAIADAAELKRSGNEHTFSSRNFFVYSRLTLNKNNLIERAWAGHVGSDDEVEYAKPQAEVELARDAIKRLTFKEHTLTDQERAWTSEKFMRDWKKDKGFDWWVRKGTSN